MGGGGGCLWELLVVLARVVAGICGFAKGVVRVVVRVGSRELRDGLLEHVWIPLSPVVLRFLEIHVVELVAVVC
jgi:hypothetical protein